jgi:predicted Zn-dependent protease
MSEPLRSNDPNASAPSGRNVFLAALRRGDVRDAWWVVLDFWEARARFRRVVYIAAVAVVVGSLSWFLFYPRWAQRNAIKMTRQWMEAGNLPFASDTLGKALERNPADPELWSLAAEIAHLRKQKELEIEYARRAASAAPGDPRYLLELASSALRGDMPDDAREALSELPAAELARSSWAHRMLGELRRREQDLPAAREHFETALKIDGPGAVDEVPLALCLLADADGAAKQRGRELLHHWTNDPQWGATALRILLEDALGSGDRAAVLASAVALMAHPQCTFGDMPVCLRGIAFGDEKKFGQMLTELEQRHRVTAEASAQLIGWLNQIGKSEEALKWLETFSEKETLVPPVAQAKAEALRAVNAWVALRDWTQAGDWGQVDFIRWCYAYKAALALGDDKRAEELWSTIYGHALANSVHAHFSASLIYSWGMVREPVDLWWRAATGSGIAYDALGALARHYQVQRDAEGQYKVFSQLRTLRPQDDDIANNFVFFAVLTGKREQQAERLIRDVLQRHPANPAYAATCAYVLSANGRPSEALRMIEPLAAKWPRSDAVRFAYGLALAGVGEKEKAAEVLRQLRPESLTTLEVEQIEKALGR